MREEVRDAHDGSGFQPCVDVVAAWKLLKEILPRIHSAIMNADLKPKDGICSSVSWELRTAMSMARLFCNQGKRRQARDCLATILGWFTEGFDTLDLRQARTLLDALAADDVG